MMGIRAWGSNRFHDPERPRALSGRPHAGPTGSPSQCVTARVEGSGSLLLEGKATLIRALVPPNAPGDASDAVGEGDGGGVVAPCLGGADGPGLKAIGLRDSVSGEESGASPVDEEHTEVAVAPFGDGSETPGSSCGGLAGCEAKEGGEGPTGGKAANVSDGGNEGGGREDADARYGHEEADGRDEWSEALELVLEIVGPGLEVLDLEEGLMEGVPEIGGQTLVVESTVCVCQECARALGQGLAEFPQEAPDGIDASCSAAEIPGA